MKKTLLAITALTAFASFNANAASSASGLIKTGSTFNVANAFEFTNTSTSGQKITSLTWDLSTIGGFFDTVDGGLGDVSSPFKLSITSSSVGEIFPTLESVDGSSSLTINFTDFDAGETFKFGVDTDYLSSPDSVGDIDGADFIGAIVSASFSDGTTTYGAYEATTLAGYGTSVSITSPSPVPVPAAALLFAPALMGFVGLRRKAKKIA